jgi:hypothetical protein
MYGYRSLSLVLFICSIFGTQYYIPSLYMVGRVITRLGLFGCMIEIHIRRGGTSLISRLTRGGIIYGHHYLARVRSAIFFSGYVAR